MAGLNLFTNNAGTTLATGINSSVTSLTVAAATGGLFPNPTAGQYFYCTLSNAAGTTIEIVKVTARSTDTFTIVRGQDGTTAAAFIAGDKVELRLTAADLQNFPQLDSTNTFALAQTFTTAPVFTDATGTRSAMSAAKSGANSDITSITGLTTPLTTAQGGTGAASLAAATIATLGYTTTATAAGTTTLTASSTATQFFTGSTTQTVVLPVTSTLTQGQQFTIHNNSSGAITINSSGSNLVATADPNTTTILTCILTSGTTAASWDADLTGFTTSLPVSRGGTGATSATAYAVQCGGTTSTGAHQSIASVGTAGQILTSNGAGALPTFQTAAGGGGYGNGIIYGEFGGTASRSGSVMTVTAVSNATGAPNAVLRVGDAVSSVVAGTSFGTITSFGTGTGGVGTYNMSASGTIASTTVYNSGGTFTVPAGKTVAKITAMSGGGGGAGGLYLSSNGGWGGYGGYGVGYATGLTPGGTVTVTVGKAGQGGAVSTNGTAGGASSFGSYLTITGGGAGTTGFVFGSGGSATGSLYNANTRIASASSTYITDTLRFSTLGIWITNYAYGNRGTGGTAGSDGKSPGPAEAGLSGTSGFVMVEY
jgi:hypothetical protein